MFQQSSSKLSELNYDICKRLFSELQNRLGICQSLEEGAKQTVELIYHQFKDLIVLTRLYANLPFEMLTHPYQQFVNNFAKNKGISDQVNPAAPVLTLLGSYGQEPQWSNSVNSRNHLAIPLVSHDFIETIPMVAGLLKDLGVKLVGYDNKDNSSQIVKQINAGIGGSFYVSDAHLAINLQGEKIISDQNFVESYNVKTVFAIVSSYLSSDRFICLIIFTREQLASDIVYLLGPVSSILITQTLPLVKHNKIFQYNSAY